MTEDHETIYLQADDESIDEEIGRQWCQDDVWRGEGCKYIRYDIFEKLQNDYSELIHQSKETKGNINANKNT